MNEDDQPLTQNAVTYPIGKFNRAIFAFRILRDIGNYDWGIAGALGEIYAEEKFGMKKAERGEPGIDGFIGKRSVSVKTKEAGWIERSAYFGITKKNIGIADDLLVILLSASDSLEPEALGPLSFDELDKDGVFSTVKKNGDRRYYLRRIRKYIKRKETDANK